tara:strand:- start:3301 stop:3837 length:537 start_codon:yes stop_codon:yes gene_type:complete
VAVRKTAAGLRLKRWFKEDWRTPKGKKGYEGGENTFRPTKRITKDTPTTWSELSPGEKRRAQIEKDTKGRVSRYKKKKVKAIKKAKKGMGIKTSIKSGNFRPTKSGAGMTAKGVKAYRRANPGSKLQTAVTEDKPKGKRAKRRKSYCARSLGQLKRSSQKTQNDPNSRIRQARRRWKC